MIRFLVGLWLAVLLAATSAYAQKFPDHGGKAVVDQAGLLSPAQVTDLNSKATALLEQTGRPFVVATVNSLEGLEDRKSTRLNSSHGYISYAVFCLKKKKKN